ncbi:MAG: alkyl sulfatase C-terminal domain-containing protein [Candidatus Binatia bacterium]
MKFLFLYAPHSEVPTELRHGIRQAHFLSEAGDLLQNISLDLYFAAIATRVNGPKADGETMTFNFVFTDVSKTIVVRLENVVLHHQEAAADPRADATVRLTREFWLKLVRKQASLKELIFSDALAVEGSRLKLLSLFRLLDDPDENFAIVTP